MTDMAEETGRRRKPWIVLNLASLVVILFGLKSAASVVTLVLVAVFIAMVSAPAVLWLQRRRIPPVLAALSVVLAVLALLSGVGVLLGTSANGFVRETPVYRERLNEQTGQALDWLRQQGLADYGTGLLQSIDPGSIMSVTGTVFSAVGGLLGNSLVIMLIVTFILLEVPGMPSKFRAAFPDADQSMSRFGLIAGNVERYVGLKTLISLATGVLTALWLAILGVDFPVLWGVLVFLLNYIPTFGSIIAAVPPSLLALVQFGLGKALLAAAGFVVINFLMGSVVEPRVMGRSMGLSTLVVFLSLLAWGSILGTVGMFLAVPLTMAMRIVLDGIEETRWLAVLMGPEPREPAAPADTASE